MSDLQEIKRRVAEPQTAEDLIDELQYSAAIDIHTEGSVDSTVTKLMDFLCNLNEIERESLNLIMSGEFERGLNEGYFRAKLGE